MFAILWQFINIVLTNYISKIENNQEPIYILLWNLKNQLYLSQGHQRLALKLASCSWLCIDWIPGDSALSWEWQGQPQMWGAGDTAWERIRGIKCTPEIG